MVGTDNSKVLSASFAGASRHGTQPCGLILLINTLWHGWQVFGMDPAVAIVLRDQDTALLTNIKTSGMERFCSSRVSVKDTEGIERKIPLAATPQIPIVNSTSHILDNFILLMVPRCIVLQSSVEG